MTGRAQIRPRSPREVISSTLRTIELSGKKGTAKLLIAGTLGSAIFGGIYANNAFDNSIKHDISAAKIYSSHIPPEHFKNFSGMIAFPDLNGELEAEKIHQEQIDNASKGRIERDMDALANAAKNNTTYAKERCIQASLDWSVLYNEINSNKKFKTSFSTKDVSILTLPEKLQLEYYLVSMEYNMAIIKLTENQGNLKESEKTNLREEIKSLALKRWDLNIKRSFTYRFFVCIYESLKK